MLKDLFRWLMNGLLDLLQTFGQELINWAAFVLRLIKKVGWDVAHALIDTVAGWLPGVDPTPINDALTVANTYFPVSETIAYSLMLFVLWACVFLYRLFKSWVPTASN